MSFSLALGTWGLIACAAQQPTETFNLSGRVLQDWALARCFSKVASGTPTEEDAAKSAAAYLEMGTAEIGVYAELDALVSEALDEQRSGSVKSGYNTMKCIDLFRSDKLRSVISERSIP